MYLQPRMTFINLPVKDLKRAMDFFAHIGFAFNSRYTDDTAACMVINEQTYAMLITEARFKEFTDKEIIDASKQVEVLVGISVESREQVDVVVNNALDAGGSLANNPIDYGFMYQASFKDLDGHVWELIYMDSEAAQ